MRDSSRPRSARAPRTSSFRKLTRSRAISTASRSLDAPSDALASSRSRGSSQNALRTFPIRVARAPDAVTRDRDDRRPVFESRRLDVVDTGPRFSYATEQHTVRTRNAESIAVGERADMAAVETSSTADARNPSRCRSSAGGKSQEEGSPGVNPGTLSFLSDRSPRKVVGATGFEPATPCAQGRCATRLRYAPTP